MTAVARGAAIHAATIELPAQLRQSARIALPGLKLSLEYERSSKQKSHFVAGKIDGPASRVEQVSVEIRRGDGLWSSGRLPVNAAGVFTATLSLIEQQGKPALSRFTTTLLDASGRSLCSIDEPEVWFQLPGGDVKPHLTNALRVGIDNNETVTLIPGHVELPARGRATLKTTKTLRKGSNDELDIPVVQAVTSPFGNEDDHADCCVRIGTLVVKGADVRRDLPGGSNVELRIACNESQVIRLEAHIPGLGEDFEIEFDRNDFAVTAQEVEKRFERTQTGLRQVEALEKEQPLPVVAEALKVIRHSRVMDGLREELARARGGEKDSLSRSYRRTLELAGGVNRLRELQRPARIARMIAALEGRLTGKDAQDVRTTENDYHKAVGAGDQKALVRIEKLLDELEWRVRRRPVVLLLNCVRAFPERFRGTQEQIAAFKEMEGILVEAIELEKAGASLPDELLERAERSHQKVLRLWGQQLSEWMKNLPPGDDDGAGKIVLRK